MTHSKLSVRKAFNVLHFHWPVKSWRMHAPLPNKIIRSCKIHLHRYLKSGKAIAKMSEDIFISFHLQKIHDITVLHFLTRLVSWYTEILCFFFGRWKEIENSSRNLATFECCVSQAADVKYWIIGFFRSEYYYQFVFITCFHEFPILNSEFNHKNQLKNPSRPFLWLPKNSWKFRMNGAKV